MTHCKIRLSLGSVKTQNQSIFHRSNNLFILIQMYQGFIPKKMNAKSHPARQLAPIAFLAQKPEMRQLRVNCASGWYVRQFQYVEERKGDHTQPSATS